MMTTDRELLVQIRRRNLKEWFQSRTVPEKDRSYVSQLINGKTASFGEKAARRLEKENGMPEFYLDNEHSTLAAIDDNEPRDGDIVIDVLNVEASAGHGATGDLVEVVTQLSYAPEQYYQMFHGLSPENTRVINLKGDSMTPTFNSGDMLFVDISVTYFDGDGIYVFNYKGQTYVKRLQHIGDALLVISDNKAYKEWQISEENQDQFHIQAKVKVHQSQKLNWLG